MRRFETEQAILLVAALGVGLRLLLLASGLVRLRGYRSSARLLDPLPGPVSEACALTGVPCAIAISDQVSSPATFGLFRPIILLPVSFLELSCEAQRAIVCHELLHVRRKDWLAALAEESIGCLLWFQPAVYVLIADIRLAREKVVDRVAVGLTGSKEPYVEALLAVASAPVLSGVVIAPLFLHRRHLKSRVKFLFEELSMSKTRLAIANVSAATLLGAAGWISMVSFPLTAAPQQVGERKDSAGTLTKLDLGDVPNEFKSKLEAALQPFIGLQLTSENVAKIRAAMEPVGKFAFLMRREPDVAEFTLKVRTESASSLPVRTVDTSNLFGPGDPGKPRIRVGDGVIASSLLQQVRPAYPVLAKDARIQGTVTLGVLIDTDGTIKQLRLMSGHPLLVQAAQDAVSQWIYKPTLLNGNPVEVVSTVDVNFTLEQ